MTFVGCTRGRKPGLLLAQWLLLWLGNRLSVRERLSPVRMGRNSLNGRWHSEDGPSRVPLLRPCLCLTEPLSLGTCHSPHPTGQAPGYSITHLSRLAPRCTVSRPLCHPLSVPVPPPQGPQRREGLLLPPAPLPAAPVMLLSRRCGQTVRAARQWGGHAGPLATGLETSSGTLRGPLASFWMGVPVSAFIQQPLPTTPFGASFWKPAARATAGHCSPEFLLGAGRLGSPSPLGPWDGRVAPSVRPCES